MGSAWLCLQLGSREHYAIPRALHQRGLLGRLFTDTWIPRPLGPAVRGLHKSFGQRRHDAIPDSRVSAATLGRVWCDLSNRWRGKSGWDTIITRNAWFQDWAVRELEKRWTGDQSAVCFSYSYTARLPFRAAKKRGLRCILGQIDPGPEEARVVQAASAGYEDLRQGVESSPPENYWDEWREEVELADTILVNSPWSAELLRRAGVPAHKMVEVPLAYESTEQTRRGRRASSVQGGSMGVRFSEERPMVVLFLGQLVLRKGIGQLFEAIGRMSGLPIRFILAGPVGVRIPERIRDNPQVEILGAVDRETARGLYAGSDVFILPTLSDGFAITQLEAQSCGLPVIASRFCGAVVQDGINGVLLDAVTPEAIGEALLRLLNDPGLLGRMSMNSRVDERFSLAALGEALVKLTDGL